MSRSARRIAPLLRSLLFGAMTATAVMGVTGTVVGCADENDPATHVKKLSDVATRAPAVNRLIQFFEDAMTRDKDDRNGPTVKPLLDLIVQPMTETCVAGDLDERTNSKLIKFLSDTRDPRSEACIIKALKDYKVDSTEEDVRSAARAVKALKLKSAAGPLMEAFTKVRASKPKASTIYRDVSDAMEELQDPSWEAQLITYLGRPVDPKVPATVTDEMFWQITSAKILGLMKSNNAVKPLIKMVLSPYKAAGAMTSILALIKIGKPAIGPTVALLKGEDTELVEYSKVENVKAAAGDKNAEKGAATAHLGAAALILATIGRDESAAPLIEALGKADDTSRAIIARELAKVPKTPATVKAFQEAFEKTPVTLSIPGASQGAREILLESAGTFYDASFVPWILKQAKDMKGEEGDLEPIREASLSTAMKIATADQFKLLEDLYNVKVTVEGKSTIVGKGFEKEFKIAKDLATTCGDKLDCYIGKLAAPESQKTETQFQGIKSAYMIGVLGNPAAREKIIEVMPKLTNGAVRFAAVSVIDALSPKGDAAIAASLQKMVDAAEASKDAEKIKLNNPFRTVIYRLNARAQ
jgi:hypothetical protein